MTAFKMTVVSDNVVMSPLTAQCKRPLQLLVLSTQSTVHINVAGFTLTASAYLLLQGVNRLAGLISRGHFD